MDELALKLKYFYIENDERDEENKIDIKKRYPVRALPFSKDFAGANRANL